jgi:hypothetical protein
MYFDDDDRARGRLADRDVRYAAYHEAAHVVMHLRARFRESAVKKMWVTTVYPADLAGYVQIDGPELYLPGMLADGSCSEPCVIEELERRRRAEVTVKLAGVAAEATLANIDDESALRDLREWVAGNLNGLLNSGSDFEVALDIAQEIGSDVAEFLPDVAAEVRRDWPAVAAIAEALIAKPVRRGRKILMWRDIKGILYRLGAVEAFEVPVPRP